MAESELEQEHKRLEDMISKMESAALADPVKRPVVETAVGNMRARLGELEKKIKEKTEQAENQLAGQAEIARAVERETALDAGEKQSYSQFLEKEFFTRADFGNLESFYDKTYDKLSDSGKAQMHNRIWGGISHGEFEFGELPENVKKKDAALVYDSLKKGTGIESQVIPEHQQAKFINAYEGDQKQEAYKILEKGNFAKNAPSIERAVTREKTFIASNEAEEPSSSADKKSLGRKDFSNLDLGQLSPPEVQKIVSAERETSVPGVAR